MEPKSKGKHFLFNGIAENTRVKDNNIKATSGAMESAWSDWFDRDMLNSARLEGNEQERLLIQKYFFLKDYVENQRYLLARVWIFVKCIVLSVNVLEGKINAESLVL